MSITQCFDDMIESRLLNLHTAYIARILSVSGDNATLRPLNMIKRYGENAQKQAPVQNVPILSHCRGKIVKSRIDGTEVLKFEGLKAGDIVFCVCAERNITEALKGNESVPPAGHHSLSDSVIVGVL